MKGKKLLNGFELLAERMDCLFFPLLPNRKKRLKPTSNGIAASAMKELSSSFKKSARGVRTRKPNPTSDPLSSSTTSPIVATPSVVSSSRSSARSTRSTVSTATEISHIVPTQLNYKVDVDCDIFDRGSIPLSSTNRRTKRLSNMAIIRLRKSDNFTLVLPPRNASEPAFANSMRSRTLVEIGSVF